MAYAAVYDANGLMVNGGDGAELLGEDGRRYIDFSCGHGAAIFGHAHLRLVEALEEASRRPWTIGSRLREPHREALLEKLGSLLEGGKAFLCNSGAEAIEAALKLVTVVRPDRKKILALRRSFHGRTLGALSLTFNPRYRNPWQRLLVPVEHVSMEEAAGAIDENTAAVFVEPVQGEGGVHVMPKDVGSAITSACREYGAILVVDEIQTGWGRCGEILASPLVGLERYRVSRQGHGRRPSYRCNRMERVFGGFPHDGTRQHVRGQSLGLLCGSRILGDPPRRRLFGGSHGARREISCVAFADKVASSQGSARHRAYVWG